MKDTTIELLQKINKTGAHIGKYAKLPDNYIIHSRPISHRDVLLEVLEEETEELVTSLKAPRGEVKADHIHTLVENANERIAEFERVARLRRLQPLMARRLLVLNEAGDIKLTTFEELIGTLEGDMMMELSDGYHYDTWTSGLLKDTAKNVLELHQVESIDDLRNVALKYGYNILKENE